MIRKSIKEMALLAFMALSTAACNNDIFVDDPDSFQDIEATIAGDNGSETFNIQTKGLERITVNYYGDNKILTYYNGKGDEIPEKSPASEVAKISCEVRGFAYDIYIQGNRILVHTIENASSQEMVILIRLDYGYTTKFIGLTVEPGRPMEVASVRYDDGLDITDAFDTKISSLGFNNNSPLPQQMPIKPYLAIQGKAVVTPSERWAGNEEVSMQLPTCADGTWKYLPETSIRLSETRYYRPKDWEITEDVDIPAYTSVDILTIVTFSKAVAHGEIVFRMPVSGKLYPTQFTTEVIEPTSYEIIVTNKD